jgi:hypothetical protein
LLIYSDGTLNLQVRLDGQTAWLTQAQLAELYQATPQNITLHIQGIYDDSELPEEATCKEYSQVRQEGSRQVQRVLKHYSLDMTLAVGGARARGQRHGSKFNLFRRELPCPSPTLSSPTVRTLSAFANRHARVKILTASTPRALIR